MQERQQQLLYLFISTGILLYGVLGLGWSFFAIIYLWWWESLMETILNTIAIQRNRRTKASKAPDFRVFVILAMYWLFIILLFGNPSDPGAQPVFGLPIVLFQDPLFNLSLLLLLLHIGSRFIRTNELIPKPEFGTHFLYFHYVIVIGGFAMVLASEFGLDRNMIVVPLILGVKMVADLIMMRKNAATTL